ncbi:MAG: VWA domain-containing protein [Crenarchaeota archaeon]|nr:MAG: VWA domain-containing protein [Thermoproteota archaeon]
MLASPVIAGQNVVIVVDDSGSMGSYMDANVTRIEAARTALKETVRNLPDDTRLGIITLNGYWEPDKWLLPFGHLNKTDALQKIDTLVESGGTPLSETMKAGCDVLLADRAKNGYGIYTLLVVTDGEANNNRRVDDYVKDIKNRGVTIDAIGVDMDQDHSLATKVHAYRRANDPESLMKAISATFAEPPVADKAAAEEDFALLEGLPDGAAPKLIDALVTGNNTPIGESQEVVFDENGKVQFDEQGNPVTATVEYSTNWWPVYLAAVVFIIVVIVILGAALVTG